MPALRVLRTSKATLSRTFYLDEQPTDATGPVTVTVTRLDGTVVDTATASGPVSNVYSYTFPGRDVLDELVVSWAATVSGDAIVVDSDRLQVVGGFLFSLTAGRAVDSALADTTKFPSATLVEKRTEVEDECERICGQAMVPRFRRLQLNGTGTADLPVGDPWLRAVRAVSLSTRYGQPFIPLTSTQLSYIAPGEDGVARRTDGGIWLTGTRNVIIEVEHGRDMPPTEITRVAKIRFKSLLMQSRSPLPDRAERIAVTDMGTVLLAQPDTERTGLPEVDAVYSRYADPLPGFG